MLSIGQLNTRPQQWACPHFWLVDTAFLQRSTFLSTLPPLSLYQLDVRPQPGFPRKHQPQTAYLCRVLQSLGTTSGIRRYGFIGVTAEPMAFSDTDSGVWPWACVEDYISLEWMQRCHLLDRKYDERGAKVDSLRPMEDDVTFAVSSRPGMSPVKRQHHFGQRN